MYHNAGKLYFGLLLHKQYIFVSWALNIRDVLSPKNGAIYLRVVE
jgi:hypothetical protein